MGYITKADRMLIGGKLVESTSGAWDECINPANEQPIGRVPAGTKEDVDRAVIAAQTAWPDWARTPIKDRAEIIRKFGTNLIARAQEIFCRSKSPTAATQSSRCAPTSDTPSTA